MSDRRYRSLPDLADQIQRVARSGREVRLSPDTAAVIVAALRAFASEPGRDEVALALCTIAGKCPKPCMTCVGRANLVQRLYRGEPGPFDEPPDPGAGAARRTASLTIVSKSG